MGVAAEVRPATRCCSGGTGPKKRRWSRCAPGRTNPGAEGDADLAFRRGYHNRRGSSRPSGWCRGRRSDLPPGPSTGRWPPAAVGHAVGHDPGESPPWTTSVCPLAVRSARAGVVKPLSTVKNGHPGRVAPFEASSA